MIFSLISQVGFDSKMGGANSFGAGGWMNTELEEAMPVDFQIHNAKVQAVGALVGAVPFIDAG